MDASRQALDELESRIGYALKRASVALHHAMEEAVRPHGVTVAQYACLELLARNPGASQAELARGAFVTRQAAHQVLARLLDEGLVTRGAHPTLGQRHQVRLTRRGEARRRAAARAVDRVEEVLGAALPQAEQHRLAERLWDCTRALEVAPPGPGSL